MTTDPTSAPVEIEPPSARRAAKNGSRVSARGEGAIMTRPYPAIAVQSHVVSVISSAWRLEHPDSLVEPGVYRMIDGEYKIQRGGETP